jgi:glycosyltransferase involved in cell wall biosynthesis
MGISIVGVVGVPANYGGFETLVENLLPMDEDVLIYCSSRAYANPLSEYKGAKLHYIPLDANGIQSILYDIVCLLHSLLFTKNSLLVLGVSGAIFIPIIRLLSSRKIVTNIDGLEWKRDKWGAPARAFLKFSERIAVQFSHVVIADNQGIANHVQDAYRVKASVIAYGGDHAIVSEKFPMSQDYALALCRIEPENNVGLILEAFAQAKDKKLIFVGNWDRSVYGRRLKKKYQGLPNISLLDPIYDLARLFDIRAKCKLYIHGHSAGGTNPSLVEMMFFGKAIACFDCTYNRYTTKNMAMFFGGPNELLSLISNSDASWDGVGLGLLEVAQKNYQWSHIKEQYLALVT